MLSEHYIQRVVRATDVPNSQVRKIIDCMFAIILVDVIKNVPAETPFGNITGKIKPDRMVITPSKEVSDILKNRINSSAIIDEYLAKRI